MTLVKSLHNCFKQKGCFWAGPSNTCIAETVKCSVDGSPSFSLVAAFMTQAKSSSPMQLRISLLIFRNIQNYKNAIFRGWYYFQTTKNYTFNTGRGFTLRFWLPFFQIFNWIYTGLLSKSACFALEAKLVFPSYREQKIKGCFKITLGVLPPNLSAFFISSYLDCQSQQRFWASSFSKLAASSSSSQQKLQSASGGKNDGMETFIPCADPVCCWH